MAFSQSDRPHSRIGGISHMIVEVGDVDSAMGFYSQVLGLKAGGTDRWPDLKKSASLKLPNGQWLVLAEAARRNDLSKTAVHHAYAVSPAVRDRILTTLKAVGVAVRDYREDHPGEANDRLYFEDPFGNKVQIVVRDLSGNKQSIAIDHAAIQVNDVLWAEAFYGDWLGLTVDHRFGWATSDYMKAKETTTAENDDSLPGARRWDSRYSQYEKERKVVRPNPQLYFSFGEANGLAVYLAGSHYQTAPEDMLRGAPRLGLKISEDGLPELAKRLEQHGNPVEGPIRHGKDAPVGASLYVRDPGGNLVELAVNH